MPRSSEDRFLQEMRELFEPFSNMLRIDAVLGRGGMGFVLQAYHRRLRTDVAVKLIFERHLRSATLRSRFTTEATTMARLRTPHVVHVMDFDVVADNPFLIMELVAGGSVEDHAHEFGVLPLRLVADVAIQTLRGLQEAHEHNIVHRDIKPENLMVQNGVVKILDFGIAHVEEATRAETSIGSVLGTYFYMSPEQRSGLRIDKRSDLHAVGAVMWVLALRPTRLPIDTAFKVFAEYPQLLESLGPLAAIITRATAKEPDDRYPDARSMITAIEEVLHLLPELPAETPELGSAPAARAEREAYDVESLQNASVAATGSAQNIRGMVAARGGRTMIPSIGGSDVVVTGSAASASSHVSGVAGQVSQIPVKGSTVLPFTWYDDEPENSGSDADQPPESGTLHGDLIDLTDDEEYAAELAATRRRSRRKLTIVGIVLLALIVLSGGLILFLASVPEPIQEIALEAVEQEVVPATPPMEIEEAALVEATEVPEPEVVEVIAETPTPELAHAPVVAAKKSYEIKRTTPEPTNVVEPPSETISEVETALVKLILGPGDATATLTGSRGTFTLSRASRNAQVPLGTYSVKVVSDWYEGGVQEGSLEVTLGMTTLQCNSRLGQCNGI